MLRPWPTRRISRDWIATRGNASERNLSRRHGRPELTTAPTLIAAEGVVLARILDATWPGSHDGLSRHAYGQFHAAQATTAWGGSSRRHVALVDGADLLASAEQYDLVGVLDGRPVRICGIGPVFSGTRRGHASTLIDMVLDQALRNGAQMALLFARPDPDDRPHGFGAVSLTDVTLSVAEPPRYGAPMTMVRGGDERDLAAIVAMGRARAEPFLFHLDRDIDFVRFAITRKRLLAGLGAVNARELHFFIAEEGTTAAAYVVISVVGDTWTLEECGDRDPSGARVGALLQALIARQPIERRPTIHAWLPPRFMPPQITIASSRPPAETLMVRMLNPSTVMPRIGGDDVLYWRNDVI